VKVKIKDHIDSGSKEPLTFDINGIDYGMYQYFESLVKKQFFLILIKNP